MKPITEQPRYVAALGEINELNAALAKIQTRLVEIDAQVHEGAPQLDRHSNHVAAALSFAATGVVSAPGNSPAALQQERDMLQQQAAAVQGTVSARSAAMYTLKQELSYSASRQVAPEHAALCTRYLKALRDLGEIEEEEVRLFGRVEKLGYDTPNFEHRIQWHAVGLGRISELDSMLWRRVREFAKFEN